MRSAPFFMTGLIALLFVATSQVNTASARPKESPSASNSRVGIDWREVPGNPSIVPGKCLTWKCAGVSDPALVRRPDGSLLTWFTTLGIAKSGGGFVANGPYTGRAVADGALASVNISPEAPVIPVGPAGAWDRYVETPSVAWDAQHSQFVMWYLGYAEKGGTTGFVAPAIGEMQSSDAGAGVRWTRPPSPIYRPAANSWDYALVTGPTVVHGPDGLWRLYYTGVGKKEGIGLLTSKDGVHWAAYTANPVFEPQQGAWDDQVLEQSVIYYKGLYWMWYSGYRGSLKPDTTISIGVATSADGIHWSRYAGNPIIKPGPKGSWNDLRVLAPDVIVEPDGSLLMAAYGLARTDIGKSAGSIGYWRSGK